MFRYVPPAVPLELPLSSVAWPRWGRVGYCADGQEWRDCMIFLYQWNKEKSIWHLCVVSRELGGDVEVDVDIVDSDSDHWISKLFVDNPVTWSPVELDDSIEHRVFGLRRRSMRQAFLRGHVAAGFDQLRARGVSADLVNAGANWPDVVG